MRFHGDRTGLAQSGMRAVASHHQPRLQRLPVVKHEPGMAVLDSMLNHGSAPHGAVRALKRNQQATVDGAQRRVVTQGLEARLFRREPD